MRRLTLMLALVTALVMTLAGTAAAGEITGNGERPMVVGETEEGGQILHAKSACAFSGLNDEYVLGLEDPVFGRTQNWGQIPKEIRDLARAGESPDSHVVPPNIGCNPSHGGH